MIRNSRKYIQSFIWLTGLLMFIFALLMQVQLFANWFVNILETKNLLLRGQIVFIFAMLSGVFCLKSWRRVAWISLIFVFILSALKSVHLRATWPVWYGHYDNVLYRNFILQIGFWGLAPIIATAMRNNIRFRTNIKIFLGVVAIVQSVGILLQLARIKLNWFQVFDGNLFSSLKPLELRDSFGIYSDAYRLSGFLRSSNLAGIIIVMTWPALLLDRSRKFVFGLDGFRYIAFAFVGAGIFLTYSRAAYIGFCIQLVCIAFLSLKAGGKYMVKYKIPALLSISTLIALIFPKVISRFAAIIDIADASILNRLKVYFIALNLLGERPISGWGPAVFSTLYNRFYKMPNENYAYPDIHSAVFHAFFEIGIVGVTVGIIVFLGLRPAYLLRKLPPWLWISLVGAFIPLLSDNPRNHPGFLLSFVWIASCVMAHSINLEHVNLSKPKLYSRWPSVFVLTILGLWISGYIMPILDPYKRFENELNRCWRGPSGKTSYFIEDLTSGAKWRHNSLQSQPAASVGTLAIAAAVLQNSNQKNNNSGQLNAFPVEQKGIGILNQLPRPFKVISLENALFLMLQNSDTSASNSLLDCVGESVIASRTEEITGRAIEITFSSTKIDSAGKTGASSWIYIESEINPEQAAKLMEYIVNDSSPLGDIARRGLNLNNNCWGATRHLQRIKDSVFHKEGSTDLLRNDVLLVQNGSENWVLSVFREDDVPRIGIDQPAFRALGDMGWKCHLFFGG